MDICKRHGIETRELNADDIRDLYPGDLARHQARLMLPNNAFTINPQRLVRTLGRLLVEAGGLLVNERVLKIIPREKRRLSADEQHRQSRRSSASSSPPARGRAICSIRSACTWRSKPSGAITR
jgi:glycine/D-amino acid oxidase-like deaminating enzyme